MRESYFQSKKVWITGAALGLGKELSTMLAKAGAELCFIDIREKELHALQQELAAYTKVSLVVFDLLNYREVHKLVDQCFTATGSVDIIINNAAIVNGGAFWQLSLDEHFKTFEINTLSLTAICHALIPRLLTQSHSSQIMNIASISALQGFPFASTYGASKSAVYGLTEALEAELEREHPGKIYFSVACPSYINTGMFKGAKAPLLTRMLDTQTVASAVLETLEKKKFRLILPWIARLSIMIKHWLPHSLWKRFLKLMRVNSGMDHWHGR